jgi:tetraacyldisaccharide 4'-kinase
MRLEAPPPPRSPWQLLYGGAHALRGAYYRGRAGRLPRPVISVGNLHWGGSGKTPLTAALAAHLRDRGLRVCILSRGYGSQGNQGSQEGSQGSRGRVRVVSTGEGPLLGPLVAGDEPVLLAGELPGVAVVVAAERLQAGRHALRHLEPPPDLFLLDDAFSHLALRRDLDLLAFPAADPWAGGRLPPSGRLREPLAAAARASAVLLTGAPEGSTGGSAGSSGGSPGASDNAGEALAAALRPYGFRGPGFASRTRPGRPRLLDGSALPPGSAVFLVSGVARPDSFTAAVRAQGFEIRGELRFGDHHRYPPDSLARLAEAFRASGAAAVLTTAKDRVKLHGRLDLPLAELPIRAEPEPAFWRWLDSELERIQARLARGGPETGRAHPGDGGRP